MKQEVIKQFLCPRILFWKKSIALLQLWRVDYITFQPMKRSISPPLNFLKLVKLPPKTVLKNHSKSQKKSQNRKSNCVRLQMSRSTQWIYNMICFSIFFCCSFKFMLFFITVKKYTKAYYIICLLCRSTHLESNTIEFFIL